MKQHCLLRHFVHKDIWPHPPNDLLLQIVPPLAKDPSRPIVLRAENEISVGMLKFKITSLVAASLVVLTINKPQILAQDAGGASVEGSCDAAYASGDDEEHPFVPGGDDEYGNKDGLTEGGVVEDDARPSDDECENQEERCDFWAELGECSANPNYMTAYCRRSCKVCPDQKNM